MALIKQREGGVTTTDSIKNSTLCHTCKQRKPGLYTVDPYNKPICADCARIIKRPID